MVSCYSASFSIFVNHCPCITQVSNCAYSFVFLCPYKGNTTGCSDILSIDFFFDQFLVDSGTNFFYNFGDVFDLVFVFIVLFFKDLDKQKSTRGIASTQNSETLAPPWPSRMAKRPVFGTGKLSWAMKSESDKKDTVFHVLSGGEVFIFCVRVLLDRMGLLDVRMSYPNAHLLCFIYSSKMIQV